MLFLPSERTASFIDDASLYSASGNLGFDVDLQKLFLSKVHLIRANYYLALLETEEYSPLKRLTDWLAYNGYTLVTKPARKFTDTAGRRKIKGNRDVEIAVDMLELAPRLDNAALFSSDSDFRRLVEAVQRQRFNASVVSTLKTMLPLIADELRRQADQFLELAEIATCFTRRQMAPRRRPARVNLAEPASEATSVA